MRGVRHLSIEIGPRCDKSNIHTACPAHLREVDDSKTMSVEHIADIIRAALSLGFTGFVGFHFYNEPTLYTERMAAVMDLVPEARYMLWTNSTAPADPRFSWVVRSDYSDPGYVFDSRLDNYEGKPVDDPSPCFRPMIECAIDYSGDVALCCQDWRMTATDDFPLQDPVMMLSEWYALALRCTAGHMPWVCATCKGPSSEAAYRSALAEVGMG